MARNELVDAYREGRLARPVFLRRLPASGFSLAAALALAAAFAPSSQAIGTSPDGPGKSEEAAVRLCLPANFFGDDHAAYEPLVAGAVRLSGSDCSDGDNVRPDDGNDFQHNEILVRA